MARHVLLLMNREKPDVERALPHVRSVIKKGGGRIVAELDADQTPLPAELADGGGADLIIVLGGDGTLMTQSRRCVALGLPMLGVNFGKLGFMAEFDLAALEAQAGSLFDGSHLTIQDRPMLHAGVYPLDHPLPQETVDAVQEPARSLALNDAVITAGPPYRMIALSLRIDGEPGPRITGDGLIVSTPIGSTAYNVSAGGPIVSPDVQAMVITPIAAHSLSFRPVVVPATSVIELIVERINDHPELPGLAGGTALVLDGQVAVRLHLGERVVIRRHARPMRFVRNPQGSYWATLINKMRWAALPELRA